MHDDNLPPLLTVDDVARRLNVKKRTAYELLAPGGALYHLRKRFSTKTIRVCPLELEEHINNKAST